VSIIDKDTTAVCSSLHVGRLYRCNVACT